MICFFFTPLTINNLQAAENRQTVRNRVFPQSCNLHMKINGLEGFDRQMIYAILGEFAEVMTLAR
jgi:hypothetical protein